ncbi:MAG TPA: iron ABC transporter permease [Tepidisphaeraceae bacterium]|jgi:iron(III) transport system permease protein
MGEQRTKGWHQVLAGAMFVVLAVVLVWPIWQVVRVAFFGVPGSAGAGFTLGYFQEIFLDPELRWGLINSALIAVCVTTLATGISIPLAILWTRYEFVGKRLLGGLLLVPLILPPFVGALGMRQIFGRFGALTGLMQALHVVAPDAPVDWLGKARLAGIVLVEALSLYPILYLNLSAALANIDPAMEQAAANLGASRWTIFRQITLPLLRPGLLAGGTIVLIWSFTELGTPLMFDYYQVTPVQVFHRLAQVRGNPLPYAMVVVMLIISAGLYLLAKWGLGSATTAAAGKATTQATLRPLRGTRAVLAFAAYALVIALAMLPHLSVILMSFSGVGAWYQSALPRMFTLNHYGNALTHELTVPSAGNSIVFAGVSMIVDVVLGIAIAFLLVRTRVFGRRLLDGLAMLPLAVPGVVMAFGYIGIALQLQLLFKDSPAVRRMLDIQENPMLLLVIAYAVRRLPYVVRSAAAGYEQTPEDLELAARNLGASSWMTMRRVTIPLIAANLAAGALLAFAFAMLEVSDSLILAQKQSYWPITKAIYELFQRLGDGPYIASALGVWAMALLTLTVLTANAFLGKRMGALFRV